MTKREKALRDVRNKIARFEASREAAIKMLVKAELQLPILRKQAKRLAGYLLSHPVADARKIENPLPAPAHHITEDRSAAMDVPAPIEDNAGDKPLAAQPDDGLDIPTYLKRDVYEAAKRIASGNGTKADKAKVRIEKMKVGQEKKEAELTGKRRRMPLTGKAALDEIHKVR